ncbi:MAG: hypothetical protein CMQ51_07065 [Gammaproteobacteria bacterium]|nr:hypothetical protein [Gammaproteobacteria bacterium]|tara:strand:+ start:338 stop:1000 length:663 start_codon:yes stop_codon:yes gene_type:complete
MSKGHNRQTCEVLKKDIERLRESFGDNHPEVKEYDDNRRSISASASRRAKMPRSCTYCSTHGHNRRTCPTLKKHLSYAIRLNRDYCKEVLSAIEDYGIGLGAILRTEDQTLGWHKNRHFIQGSRHTLWMIVEVDWDAISFLNPNGRALRCRNMSTGEEIEISVPKMQPSLDIHSWEVASPSASFDAPIGWESGELIKKSLQSMTLDEVQEILQECGRYGE